MPATLRQCQDFHVEHVPVDLLAREELPGNIAFEELEAALRIGDRMQADDAAHEHPESHRAHAPVQWLLALDQLGFDGPGANHDRIALREPRLDFRELLDRDLVVRICVPDDRSPGRAERLPNAPAFADPLAMAKRGNSRIYGGQLANALASAVVAVCRDDDLVDSPRCSK